MASLRAEITRLLARLEKLGIEHSSATVLNDEHELTVFYRPRLCTDESKEPVLQVAEQIVRKLNAMAGSDDQDGEEIKIKTIHVELMQALRRRPLPGPALARAADYSEDSSWPRVAMSKLVRWKFLCVTEEGYELTDKGRNYIETLPN